LSDPEWGAPSTLASFVEAAAQLAVTATAIQQQVLGEWQQHVQGLRKRLDL
jgi:exodeoxyribonuclease-1